jgi:hypothetical protein
VVDAAKSKLKVSVLGPAGNTIYSESDDVNNLEKLDLLLTADGNYTVRLENTGTKSHDYGLAFEIIEPLTGDFNLDYIVDGCDLYQMADEWLTAGQMADIFYDDYNIVNYRDFADFAENWLKIDARYFLP